jgi:FlaA1/EpsC-like NDP-sugar epimerase
MISTDKAVNPTNIMGATKRIAEMYTQSLNSETGTRYITTRFGNVLGSNGSVIPRFKKQIESGREVTVTHPEITRFFMTISEACQLVLEAAAMGEGGEIFLFDMGKPVRIADLAVKMIRLSGLEEGKDISIRYTGLRPGEKLYEELLANEENTLPTHHEKILIARVKPSDQDRITHDVQELGRLFSVQDNDQDEANGARIHQQQFDIRKIGQNRAVTRVTLSVHGFLLPETADDLTLVIEPFLPSLFNIFAFCEFACKSQEKGVMIGFTYHQLLVKRTEVGI